MLSSTGFGLNESLLVSLTLRIISLKIKTNLMKYSIKSDLIKRLCGWYVSFKKIYIPCVSGLPSLYSVFKGQDITYDSIYDSLKWDNHQ